MSTPLGKTIANLVAALEAAAAREAIHTKALKEIAQYTLGVSAQAYIASEALRATEGDAI
jgi:hypothetical protein